GLEAPHRIRGLEPERRPQALGHQWIVVDDVDGDHRVLSKFTPKCPTLWTVIGLSARNDWRVVVAQPLLREGGMKATTPSTKPAQARKPRAKATPDQVRFEGREREYVYAVAMKYLKDEDEAADVAQDALLNAYRHRASFRGDSRFTTWLYRVAA